MSDIKVPVVLIHNTRFPQGTPEQLIAAGMNPREIASCAPSAGLEGAGKNVLGCNHWDRCIFGAKRNGGFKGKKVSAVGFLHITHFGESTKRDHMPCYIFMRALGDRYYDSMRDRMAGIKGTEIIEITAQEGGTITRQTQRKVDPADRSANPEYTNEPETIVVPRIALPGELPASKLSFNAQVIEEAEEIERMREEMESVAFTAKSETPEPALQFAKPEKTKPVAEPIK